MRFGSLAFAASCLIASASCCFAQDAPTGFAVYGGTCSVLMVNGAVTPKACLGTLMVNAFAGGSKTVIFHDADDEAIAFHATPRQSAHYSVGTVEVNGQAMPADGQCTIQLDARNTGEIRCEAKADGRVTSGIFEVTALHHAIGGQ